MRVIIALLCLLYSAPLWADGQERFAVVIGSNVGEPGEEPLRFAERDAGKMAQILSRFASVSEENLILLQGRDTERVESAFRAITDRIDSARAAGREALLLVYYSGHADVTALHLGTTRLEFDRLTGLIRDSGATLRVLVVDACRSGELTRVKGARPVEPFEIVVSDGLKSEGNAIITSSAAGEDAQESDRLGGGIFSHHFMMGLRGAADRTDDRSVSLSEAYRYAYEQTLRTTSRARFLQHPTYSFNMKGREDLVITRLSGGDGLGRLSLNGAGTWILLNQRASTSGVIEISSDDRSEVVLTPGRYAVRLRTERAVLEGVATIASGETNVVAREQLKAVPYGRTVRKGYRGSDGAVLGLSAGAIATGGLTSGIGPNVGAAIGLRADFQPMSMELRLRGGVANGENSDVAVSQIMIGADATALKLFDPGFLSPGFGLRVGVDWVHQRFETAGSAPSRQSVVASAAPVLRIEKALGFQASLVASLFVDGALISGESGRRLVAMPGGEIGFTVVFR